MSCLEISRIDLTADSISSWPVKNINMSSLKQRYQNTRYNELGFYMLFNSISVITVWWEDDNERLCVQGNPVLRLKRFMPPPGIKPRPLL